MAKDLSSQDLVDGVRAGDRRAVARLITLVEDGRPVAREALRLLRGLGGRAHVVGVTGPPGAGKSCLVRCLARELRGRGRRVGIVAVDPTSPITGGALLGDRVRMQDLSLDPDVFIRSVATRGAWGGVARATADITLVLDAWGSDVVLVETVGAGQADVGIARLVDSVVVVEVPHLGDDVQSIKAGILEIADVYVVNKSDREGSDQAAATLLAMLGLGGRTGDWVPPVIKTVALTGGGVAELADALARHFAYLGDGRRHRRAEDRAQQDLVEALKDELLARLRQTVGPEELARVSRAVAGRDLDVQAAVERILDGRHLDSAAGSPLFRQGDGARG